MAMLWSEEEAVTDEERDGAVHELTDIEVDEVSLVDRPATGRRFVLFKRGGLLRPRQRAERGESANKCSHERERDAMDELQKRADDLREEVRHLSAAATRMEKRLEVLEAGRPARQSDEAPPPRESLWAGVL